MKITKLSLIISLLVLCLNISAEDFLSGGIFVKSTTDTNLTSGKTYFVEKNILEIKRPSTLHLSSGHTIQIEPDSEFSIDSFNVVVQNENSQPALVRWTDVILSMTVLEGEVLIVAPQVNTNSSVVLSTQLSTIGLTGGEYKVKSTPKYDILYVIRGSVIVIDGENKSIYTSGKMVLILPNPLDTNKLMVTEKMISMDDLSEISKQLGSLTGSDNVVFAVINKKIVGINVK